MAHQRSPNCPQIPFVDAAEKGRLVYDKEHTHPAAKEVVASGLGYTGINGRSLSMIGALRQYGILEGTGEGLRVSDDAVAYFELPDGEERQEAILRMLFKPATFNQIHIEFGENLPSEQNLKHYLIKQGFLPKAAEDVIQVYRENIRLVEDGSKRYNDPAYVGVEPMAAAGAALATVQPRQIIETKPVVSNESYLPYSFALSDSIRADLLIRGKLTKNSLAILRDQIELFIRAFTPEEVSGEDAKE